MQQTGIRPIMSDVRDAQPGRARRAPAPERAGFLASLIEHRFVWLAIWDSVAWVVALWFCTWVRYELEIDSINVGGLFKAMPLVIVVQVVCSSWQGLYVGRWHLGSFEEIAALLKSV